jgi:hypothetical protein
MKIETKKKQNKKQWALRKGILFDNEIYLLSDIFNWYEEGFFFKTKRKIPKRYCMFWRSHNDKNQMTQVYFIRRSYFLEKLGMYSNTLIYFNLSSKNIKIRADNLEVKFNTRNWMVFIEIINAMIIYYGKTWLYLYRLL